MTTKFDLPNTLVGEYAEYQRLYLLGNGRTTTGNPSFTSSSSSITYTVSNNTGQNGMLLLLQTPLNDFLIRAVDWNGKVNTTGSAMTGSIILNNSAAGVNRFYQNVRSWSIDSGVTGVLKITLPRTWSSTMMRISILGYEYTALTGGWELIASGYNFITTPGWRHTSAELRGNAPFSQVRFVHDGAFCCILLGTLSTIWNISQIVIDNIITSFSNTTGWETGWGIGIITVETGITHVVTPVVRQTWHSGSLENFHTRFIMEY